MQLLVKLRNDQTEALWCFRRDVEGRKVLEKVEAVGKEVE